MCMVYMRLEEKYSRSTSRKNASLAKGSLATVSLCDGLQAD